MAHVLQGFELAPLNQTLSYQRFTRAPGRVQTDRAAQCRSHVEQGGSTFTQDSARPGCIANSDDLFDAFRIR